MSETPNRGNRFGCICPIEPSHPSSSSEKIYTYEMAIHKVIPGDAGAYRCEVTSKDKCDSSSFGISVEGERKTSLTRIPRVFASIGP